MEAEVSLQCSKERATCPVLIQINPAHATSSYSFSILVLSSHLYLGLRSGLLPSGFPIKILYGFPFSPIRVSRNKTSWNIHMFKEVHKRNTWNHSQSRLWQKQNN